MTKSPTLIEGYGESEVKEVTRVGQQRGGYVFYLPAGMVNHSEGNRHTTHGRNPHQRTEGSKDDLVVESPKTLKCRRRVAQSLHRTAGGLNLLQLSPSGKHQEAAVRRPAQRVCCALGSGQRPRLTGIQRAHPHHRHPVRVSGEKRALAAVGRNADEIANCNLGRRRNFKAH